MARRDRKVEGPTELQPTEITLCANTRGFPGNPATKNLCRELLPGRPSPPASVLPPSPCSPPVFPLVSKPRATTAAAGVSAVVDHRPAAGPAGPKTSRSSVNRCHSCQKRVWLTGFRCRCSELFCGSHRYSDPHGCSYDNKSVGRENRVVRAAEDH